MFFTQNLKMKIYIIIITTLYELIGSHMLNMILNFNSKWTFQIQITKKWWFLNKYTISTYIKQYFRIYCFWYMCVTLNKIKYANQMKPLPSVYCCSLVLVLVWSLIFDRNPNSMFMVIFYKWFLTQYLFSSCVSQFWSFLCLKFWLCLNWTLIQTIFFLLSHNRIYIFSVYM